MSDRNDNDFNDFEFDDDLFSDTRGSASSGGADDLNFDDEFALSNDDLNLDEELGTQPERRGPSRAFVVLAVIIIILFLVGLGGIIFFATRSTGPTDRDLTVTQIVQLNATQEAFLAATNTQSAINEEITQTAVVLGQTATLEAIVTGTALAQFAETQLAVEATQTALAVPTETPTPSPTPTLDPNDTAAAEQTLAALPPVAQITARFETLQAQDAILAATAAAATQAAIATNAALQPPTATGAAGPGFGSVDEVLQTATALSLTLSPQTAVPATADPNSGGLGGTPFVIPTMASGTGGGGRLPDTGLFDDVAGVGNIGTLLLMALGLVGVMLGARRLRK
jgi:hypothetical protein